jgi:YebC/PmpR family DNA-binding regulatory protein
MGRAFEYRKAAKEKRWGKMSRIFPKLAKAITVAARNGGPNPEVNPALRMAIQNAKSENMPKDNIEAAIKRAVAKDQKDLEEVVFEGYGPFGVAIIVECSTDNNQRTVANIRSYFNKANGALGKSGSVDYLFSRRAVFRIPKVEDVESLELELIDFGLEEIITEEDEMVLITEFESFGTMQKALEDRKIEINKAEILRFPNTYTELTPEQQTTINNLVDKIEDDDDVNAVYTTMAES